jgi:hypothetical protein
MESVKLCVVTHDVIIFIFSAIGLKLNGRVYVVHMYVWVRTVFCLHTEITVFNRSVEFLADFQRTEELTSGRSLSLSLVSETRGVYFIY